MMMSLYAGFFVRRYPLPKLQKILKPISCVPPLVFSLSISAVKDSAFCFHSFFPVYSYSSHNSPGKNPLVQSREATIFNLPLSSVRGDTSSGLTVFAAGISRSITSVCFSASRKTAGSCRFCAEAVAQRRTIPAQIKIFCLMHYNLVGSRLCEERFVQSILLHLDDSDEAIYILPQVASSLPCC